jgi:hypothetical protein
MIAIIGVLKRRVPQVELKNCANEILSLAEVRKVIERRD